MKKQKIIPCIVTSREGLESAVADAVALKIEYTAKKAAMELEIAEVQKRHQEGLLSLVKQIEIKESGIYIFCQQHRKELFPEKKSLDLLLATIGFRTDPPSVEKQTKKDTWTAIAIRLQSLDWGEKYIREPAAEVDKPALLSDRANLTPEQLAAAGIRFEQDENFFIDPKSDVAEKTVAEAA